NLPIDVFPDLDRPRVVILAECPGLASEEVETLVTQPIEVALLGANGVEAVRSQSTAGLTVIYVEFSWNTAVWAAPQTVQGRPSGRRPHRGRKASAPGWPRPPRSWPRSSSPACTSRKGRRAASSPQSARPAAWPSCCPEAAKVRAASGSGRSRTGTARRRGS